jgi:hypothetical protein
MSLAEMSDAVPPAYSRFIAEALLKLAGRADGLAAE